MKLVPTGSNPTLLWGMDMRERLRRIAAAQGLGFGEREGDEAVLMVDVGHAFDPSWLKFMAGRAGTALTLSGVPVITHAAAGQRPEDASAFPAEEIGSLANDALRKRERPFIDRLTPETVPALERASYFGAYKGVTDILTKYLWPEWALALTRIAARIGATPNMVTALGAALCVVAAILFHHGWYWTGLAAGLVFMVLDTVDGKLARCTITSSWWGNIFDHGIDLVHPPFWWYAWGAGLAAYGRPLSEEMFIAVMVVIVGGYVVQRLIEGVFMRRFGMHIHVWRRFDSRFRLITARRNPNMVLLFAALVVGRPDLGLVAVAGWTIVSLLVHGVQFGQAQAARRRGEPVTSWLA